MNMKKLIISGMARSGTTLLDKLLHMHEALCVHSQPYPLIFSSIKEKFLVENGIDHIYPLGPYFGAPASQLGDFHRFLDEYEISKEEMIDIMVKMRDYSGQTYHVFSNKENISQFKGSKFLGQLESMTELLMRYCEKEDPEYIGFKEIYIEEYLPYILRNDPDSRAMIVTRDVRDVLNSLNHGNFSTYTGLRRPLLYDIRNWRKSIAFSVHLENSYQNFTTIRYEDLVNDPISVLDDISRFLGVDDFQEGWFKDGIYDQFGSLWKSNSSFEGVEFISSKNVGRYKENLSKETISYIETVCGPELSVMGYDTASEPLDSETVIKDFREPHEIIRENFKGNYTEEAADEEVKRLNLLRSANVSSRIAKEYFIFEDVYRRYQRIP
jgi:hypothetical protein